MPSRRPIHAALPFALAMLLLVPLPASALTLNRIQELPELVDEARRAALVEVLAVEHALDERGLHATRVTARVVDPIFGAGLPDEGGEMTFKVYGAPVPLGDSGRLFIDGTPRYEAGQRWLLLMLGTSPWGFTSTAGLHQGAFTVTGDGPGGASARSLAGNRRVLGSHGLAAYLAPSDVSKDHARFRAPTAGPVPYAMLRAAVVALADAPPRARPERGTEVLR